MAIIRGGNAEYQSSQPDFEERKIRLLEAIRAQQKENNKLLRLSGQHIATEEVAVIAQAAEVCPVEFLDLSDNQVADEALITLFESAFLEQLRELDLGVNYITDEGVKQIAASEKPGIKNLKTLALNDNRITDAGVCELVASPNFQGLGVLNLDYNKVGNPTTAAFRKSSLKLKVLSMERCYLDDTGMADLVMWPGFAGIEELTLISNKVTDEGIKLLAASENSRGLKILRLSYNLFGDEGAKALADSKELSGLIELHVGRNSFGVAGAKALTETKTLTNLKTLILNEGAGNSPNLINFSDPDMLAPREP